MNSDICKCKATRGDHQDLAARMAAALKAGGKDPVGRDNVVAIDVSACDSFQLDRKATWHADKTRDRRRFCTLLTGCTTCGANDAVTYHKDAQGNLRHTGCPGPAAAKPASMDKSKMEAPR